MPGQPAIASSRTLQLPEALDATATATLIRSLNECRGEDVVIDASFVERFAIPCAQALGSAARNGKSQFRSLKLVGGAADFCAFLQRADARPVAH